MHVAHVAAGQQLAKPTRRRAASPGRGRHRAGLDPVERPPVLTASSMAPFSSGTRLRSSALVLGSRVRSRPDSTPRSRRGSSRPPEPASRWRRWAHTAARWPPGRGRRPPATCARRAGAARAAGEAGDRLRGRRARRRRPGAPRAALPRFPAITPPLHAGWSRAAVRRAVLTKSITVVTRKRRLAFRRGRGGFRSTIRGLPGRIPGWSPGLRRSVSWK